MATKHYVLSLLASRPLLSDVLNHGKLSISSSCPRTSWGKISTRAEEAVAMAL